MDDIPFPEKLARGLEGVVDWPTRDLILEGGENLRTLKDKACWSQRAMEKLDRLVSDRQAKEKIMAGCSCRFSDEYIAGLREEYRRLGDIDRFLDFVHENPFLIKPVREGNTIYITKAPRRPDQFAQAATPEEKRLYYCHCDHIRAAQGKVSRTYCLCGAAWAKHIWEGILERPVDVELLESVLQGDDVCRFAVHI